MGCPLFLAELWIVFGVGKGEICIKKTAGMMIPAAILGALGVAFVLLALVDFATQRKED